MTSKEETLPADAGRGLSEGLGARWKDALCPGCGEPASGLGSVGGWLFVCRPCGDARWGHPQVSYGDGGAAGLLHDARIKYRQAMHDEEVRRLLGVYRKREDRR